MARVEVKITVVDDQNALVEVSQACETSEELTTAGAIGFASDVAVGRVQTIYADSHDTA